MRDIFRSVTVSIYLFQPCFRLALVPFSMGFVVLRIVFNKCDDIRLDDDVVGVVMVFDFNVLVDYQIRLIRTPTKRFGL